jgi:hypothetical protein
MTRRIVPAAFLGALLITGAPGVASAADVYGFQPSLGQGTTKFKGKTKFKAVGSLSFETRVDGVSCQDSLLLQRRVREVVDRQIRYRWIEIRDGDGIRSCTPTPSGAKPAAERTTLSFLNDPAPYRRLLAKGPLRLRYQVTVSVGGHSVYRKTVIAAVTAVTLARAFRTG